MNLDPRTVVILTVLSTLLMSIGLFSVTRGYLAEMRGVRKWATGTVLQSIGWILLASWGVIPDVLSTLGTPLIMLALALYYHALTEFKGEFSNPLWIYILIVIHILALYFFLLIVPDMAASIVVASITAAILMFGSVKVLITDHLNKLPFSHVMTGLLFFSCAMVLVVRSLYYLVWNTAPNQTGLDHNIIQDISFLTFFVAAVVSPFTFILMCNDRYVARSLDREKELASKNIALENANQIKGQFLATMSHELRTPLNGVIGFLAQLQKTRLDEKQRGFLHTINSSSKILLGVINDILDYSKIEADKLTIDEVEICVRDIMDDAVSVFGPQANDKGVSLVCVIDHQVQNNLLGDHLRLTQIMSNLLGNAIKFTKQGEVLVEVLQLEESDLNVLLQITVSDTGIGISQHAMARLFQPFEQADSSTSRIYGGTGLGLVIVKRLLGKMGGNIDVTSELGHGAKFVITLPLKKQINRQIEHELSSHAGKTILVVTPSDSVSRSISENLLAMSMAIETVATCNVAIDYLKSLIIRNMWVDAIILDHSASDMNPQYFSEQIRLISGFGKVPLLFLGNESFSQNDEILKSFGYRYCLYKPLKASDINDAMNQILLSSQREEFVAVNYSIPELSLLAKPLVGKRVLIVDDNDINLKLARILVEEMGGDVDLAENGMIATSACAERTYDLILMDINMPVMDGLEASRRIRELESISHRTPIIALTANALPGDRERFIACGMDEYLSKPIEIKSMLVLVKKWFPQEIQISPINSSVLELSENTLPVLNPELGIQLSFGDQDAWNLVLGMMLDDLPSYALKLAEASGEMEQIQYLSHKLAGSTCYCGTPILNQAAKQVESNCLLGDALRVQDSLLELRKQIERMLELDAAGKLRKSAVVVF